MARKPVNLSLDAALLAEARSLNLNLSGILEESLRARRAGRGMAGRERSRHSSSQRGTGDERLVVGWAQAVLMRQFDVHELRSGTGGLVLILQNDLTDMLARASSPVANLLHVKIIEQIHQIIWNLMTPYNSILL